MARKTTEQYKKDLAYFRPELELIGEYTGSLEKVTVKCTKCGTISHRFANILLQHRECKICYNKGGRKCLPIPDKNELEKFYRRYGLTRTCKKYFISSCTVYVWLNKYNIEIGTSFNKRVPDEIFIREYMKPEHNSVTLSKKWDIHPSAIRNRAVDLKINKIKNQVKLIVTNLKTGETNEFNYQRDVVAFLGTTRNIVQNILSGKRRQLDGYIIERKKDYESE